jgi:hypothetical protein
MQLRSIICADSVIVDANTNRLSCINIVDDMLIPQFPAFIPQFSVLCLLNKDSGDLDEDSCELQINIDDVQIARGPLLVGYQGLNSTRAIITLGGLVIPKPGILNVVLIKDEANLGTWSVSVSIQETEVHQLVS